MEQIYTSKEVAEILHTSPNYVGDLINSGLLSYLLIRSRRVRESTLQEFIKKWEGWDISDPYNPVKISNKN